mmetsp:Transcript_57132/g.92447  ORF Transcript_57132/g.92447 Transcript_57132/m.92447 type:complete len:206 (+) Transcript_57132:251-868(+)
MAAAFVLSARRPSIFTGCITGLHCLKSNCFAYISIMLSDSCSAPPGRRRCAAPCPRSPLAPISSLAFVCKRRKTRSSLRLSNVSPSSNNSSSRANTNSSSSFSSSSPPALSSRCIPRAAKSAALSIFFASFSCVLACRRKTRRRRISSSSSASAPSPCSHSPPNEKRTSTNPAPPGLPLMTSKSRGSANIGTVQSLSIPKGPGCK